MDRAVFGWAAAGGIAYALLPWYAIEDGIFGFGWLSGYPTDRAGAPALVQALLHGRLTLLPVVVFLLAPLAVRGVRGAGDRPALLLTVGAGGTAWIAVQGFAVGGQPGIGVGGLVVFAALLMLFCVGLAAKGAFNGDRFVSGGIGAVVALVVVFVFFPVSRVLVGAVEDSSGAFAPSEFWAKLSAREVWGLDCLSSSAGCGVAWNTLILGVLVLIGVVEGISPSMEEAAQTLRADRWRTFTTVTLPLMRPGLANAFLLGFIESLADFGNPLVLGGNYHVLSISIFFAVVGAQHDRGRAAVLSIVLLVFTLGAFYAQRRWLGRRSYATVTGKGGAGLHPPLPASVRRLVYATALPWAVFTAVIYVMILFGGFVGTWGRDHRFSLPPSVAPFAVPATQFCLHWKG